MAIDLARNQDNNIKKDGRRLKKINLSEDEWAFMEKLVDLLSLFEEATTFLGGSNYVTLSLMHPTISELKSEFLAQMTLTNSEVVDFTNSTTILDIEDNDEKVFF